MLEESVSQGSLPDVRTYISPEYHAEVLALIEELGLVHTWTILMKSELALINLSELFNHSNASITRIYLGIKEEEMLSTYDMLAF